MAFIAQPFVHLATNYTALMGAHARTVNFAWYGCQIDVRMQFLTIILLYDF